MEVFRKLKVVVSVFNAYANCTAKLEELRLVLTSFRGLLVHRRHGAARGSRPAANGKHGPAEQPRRAEREQTVGLCASARPKA